MSAEPLSREERRDFSISAKRGLHVGSDQLRRWWCGLVATEARALAAEATIARVRNALAALDGHTCHEGCVAPHQGRTDAEQAMYRAVVGDVRAALEEAS